VVSRVFAESIKVILSINRQEACLSLASSRIDRNPV
jgi:hypothetical protein